MQSSLHRAALSGATAAVPTSAQSITVPPVAQPVPAAWLELFGVAHASWHATVVGRCSSRHVLRCFQPAAGRPQTCSPGLCMPTAFSPHHCPA